MLSRRKNLPTVLPALSPTFCDHPGRLELGGDQGEANVCDVVFNEVQTNRIKDMRGDSHKNMKPVFKDHDDI